MKVCANNHEITTVYLCTFLGDQPGFLDEVFCATMCTTWLAEKNDVMITWSNSHMVKAIDDVSLKSANLRYRRHRHFGGKGKASWQHPLSGAVSWLSVKLQKCMTTQNVGIFARKTGKTTAILSSPLHVVKNLENRINVQTSWGKLQQIRVGLFNSAADLSCFMGPTQVLDGPAHWAHSL